MIKKISLLLFLVTTVFLSADAQDVWSLEKCIDYARNNSLAIKQAEIGIQNALLTEKSNRMNRYPNLSAGINGGAQFGRTIDPTTNSFDNRTIGFNNLSLSAGVLIFGGNRITNSIKQAKVDAEVAKLNALDATNTLMLSVASSYLNILLSEEQLANAKGRRTLSDNQLSRIDRLIDAGSLPKNDRLNVLSQIALDEQTIIQAQNAVDIGYLQLKNLMQVEPSVDFKVGKPDIEVPSDANPDLRNKKKAPKSQLILPSQLRCLRFLHLEELIRVGLVWHEILIIRQVLLTKIFLLPSMSAELK